MREFAFISTCSTQCKRRRFSIGGNQLLKKHFTRIFCIFPFINTAFYIFIKLRSVSEKRNIFVLGEIHRVRTHAKRCTEKL